jgi:hypothetical protein
MGNHQKMPIETALRICYIYFVNPREATLQREEQLYPSQRLIF